MRRSLKIFALGMVCVLTLIGGFKLAPSIITYEESTLEVNKKVNNAVRHPAMLRRTLRYPGSSLIACLYWRCVSWNPFGAYALSRAILTKNHDAIKELLKLGVKPDEHIPWGYIEYTESIGFTGKERSAAGIVPLTRWYRDRLKIKDRWQPALCMVKDTESTRILLDAGANPNARDPNGNTPLLSTSDINIVQLLTEHGANVNLPNNKGETPIMLATSGGKYRLAELYVRSGANLSARAADGRSALDIVKNPAPGELMLLSDGKSALLFLLTSPAKYLDLRDNYLNALRQFDGKPAYQLDFLEYQTYYGHNPFDYSEETQAIENWGYDDLRDFQRKYPEFFSRRFDKDWLLEQMAKE